VYRKRQEELIEWKRAKIEEFVRTAHFLSLLKMRELLTILMARFTERCYERDL
jgi:hypothetical protein